MGTRVRALLIAAVGFLVLIALILRARSGQAPVPPPASLDQDYSSADEDAVIEIEEMMIDVAAQLTRKAWGGVLHHVADDFEGTPLFRTADGPSKVVAGVTLRSAGRDSRAVNRAGFREALDGVDVDDVVFKFPAATLAGETLTGRMKMDAKRERGTSASRWVVQGDVEFQRRGGRWLLRRFQGIEVKTEEGARRFPDVTVPLGLPIAPGDDDRDRTSITFGRLFLGGIAAGDFDGDGLVDLFVPQTGQDLLFRNTGGKFVECARDRGIIEADAGAGALFLDYDNDGLLDLLVTNYEPEALRDLKSNALRDNSGHRALALYRNTGGRFVDVTAKAGLTCRGPAMSPCAADVNGDGLLDLYVCMYKDDSVEDPRFSEEVPSVVWAARDGVANQLWINQGDGSFKEEAAARGVADTGWGLAASFCDYDADGKADLYLANDYGENRLFRNRGDGRFEDVTAKSATGDAGFGMGVTWLDYDADGRMDLYVSNMYSTAGNRILARGPGRMSREQHSRLLKMASGNSLFRNRGDGTFEDVTAGMGVGRAGWAWSSAAYDFENSGVPHLYVANGFRTSSFATTDI
ncbi:MAG TPA: VCBS repeat-containing protein [Candidatus Polarisedimenticolia bacterium]|nr:VCBS repeat-containing protein [Candidatus Polarisedimenticolia bacterium]